MLRLLPQTPQREAQRSRHLKIGMRDMRYRQVPADLITLQEGVSLPLLQGVVDLFTTLISSFAPHPHLNWKLFWHSPYGDSTAPYIQVTTHNTWCLRYQAKLHIACPRKQYSVFAAISLIHPALDMLSSNIHVRCFVMHCTIHLC